MPDVYTIQVIACPVCKERPVTVRGRCRRCYEYWYRTGKERPPWLKPVQLLCTVCWERPVVDGGRCARCRSWRFKHGFERPTNLPARYTSRPATCRNGCSRGIAALGRCWACYRYYKRHGGDRPAAK